MSIKEDIDIFLKNAKEVNDLLVRTKELIDSYDALGFEEEDKYVYVGMKVEYDSIMLEHWGVNAMSGVAEIFKENIKNRSLAEHEIEFIKKGIPVLEEATHALQLRYEIQLDIKNKAKGASSVH
jgi:hypothetical protein